MQPSVSSPVVAHGRSAAAPALHGRVVVITRPVGAGDTLARRVRGAGGQPLRLPGLALRATGPAEAVRAALQLALADDLLLFTSPAAVRFAARRAPLRTGAVVLAVGQGTARALRRHGLVAQVPSGRQDSEGLLAVPALQQLRDRRVALVGAAGGRGLLPEQLRLRGARLREVHVYVRQPARLDRRHLAALAELPANACVLWSSTEALHNLQHGLPAADWQRLCAADAVASSERLAARVRAAGFRRVRVAASAGPVDLLLAASKPEPA